MCVDVCAPVLGLQVGVYECHVHKQGALDRPMPAGFLPEDSGDTPPHAHRGGPLSLFSRGEGMLEATPAQRKPRQLPPESYRK